MDATTCAFVRVSARRCAPDVCHISLTVFVGVHLRVMGVQERYRMYTSPLRPRRKRRGTLCNIETDVSARVRGGLRAACHVCTRATCRVRSPSSDDWHQWKCCCAQRGRGPWGDGSLTAMLRVL